jgi:multiple sugar transport system substrate-binding protein
MSRRHPPVLTLLAAVVMLFMSACGSPTPEAPTQAPATQKIVIAAMADPAVSPMRNMVIEGLAEKELGLKVEWVDLPYDDVYNKALQSGKQQSGEFDLYMLDDPWVPQFGLQGITADLTSLGYTPDSGFVQSTIDLGYWPPRSGPRVPGIAQDAPAHLYALPIIGDTQLFFYRKDLVAKAPETWDDILALAKQADPAQQRYLLAMRGVSGNPIVTEWFPYLYSFGGSMFDDRWKVTFNSPEGIAALQLFVDLMKYQPKDVANFDAPDQGACYLQGQCITNIEWTGWLALAEDPTASKIVGETGWTIPPKKARHASQIGNFMMGIAAGSNHKDAALKFLQWFTSDATQREFARRGGVPVRTTTFADPELQKKYPWLLTINHALDNSIARPRTPEWAKVEAILGKHLHMAVTGQVGTQAALDTAAAEVTDYLKGQGYYK